MVFNRSLVPWTWGRRSVPIRREETTSEYLPFFSLQQEMNRLFDNFFQAFDSPMLSPLTEMPGMFEPRVDVSETDKEMCVSVELPGLDEKDVDVSISDDALTIKGEKREEKEENITGHYRMERRYGSFQRTIPFPVGVDKDKAEATFKRGVLTVKLPKSAEAQKEVKKIKIRPE